MCRIKLNERVMALYQEIRERIHTYMFQPNKITDFYFWLRQEYKRLSYLKTEQNIWNKSFQNTGR